MESKELRARLDSQGEQLARIESKLDQLLGRDQAHLSPQPPEVYTAAEFAVEANVSTYTVRDWLKFGKIQGKRVNVCHGAYREWRIPHEELLRYRREGLRDVPSTQEQAEESDESTPKKRKGLVGLDFKRRKDSAPMVDETFVDRRFGPRKPKSDDQPTSE